MSPVLSWILFWANLWNVPASGTAKKPTVTLQDTLLYPMIILTIRDTAASQENLSGVFSKDYGELFTYIHQNGLRPGKIMARYYSYQPSFILDVAVEVDKLPTMTKGRIKIDRASGGNAIIAHYKGPYGQIGMAYAAIENWQKERNKIADGRPFEVYLNDPAMVQDAFELLTDIYQLTKDKW
jgi:effector-binding domain-containing protein